MKKLIFIVFLLSLFELGAQTKADHRFKNQETYDYSGLSKAAIKFRIEQNKNDEMRITLKETPDTFFVHFMRTFYEDTINIKLHKLTFDKNDTCIRDVSTFLFSQNYFADAQFYSKACCVKWNKTHTRDLYISTFHNKKTMEIKEVNTKPSLVITYNYYAKMTKEEHKAYLTGNIDW